MTTQYQQRIQTARQQMESAGIDGLLLTPGPDLFYLTGFEVYAGERLVALLLPRAGEPRFLVPEMNVAQAAANEAGIAAVHGWSDAEGYAGELGEASRQL